MGIFDSYAEYSGLSNGEFFNESVDLIEEEAYLEEMEAATISEEDPCEALIQATLENEQNFHNIMSAVAYDEMKYFVENGTEIVYEGAKLDKFFSMIKHGIDVAWAKIKEIFNKVLTAIESWIRTDKSFLKKYRTVITGTKPSDISYTGYDINPNRLKNPIYEKLIKFFDDTFTGMERGLHDPSKDVNSASDLGDMMRAVSVGETGKMAAGEYASKVRKILGLEDKKTIKYDSGLIITELETGKEVRNNTKQAYASAKKYFAGMKSSINTAERGAKTTENNKGNDAPKNSYSMLSSLCSTGISCINTASRIHINAMNTYHHQCRAMAAMAVRKNSGTKAANASYEFDGDDEFSFIV